MDLRFSDYIDDLKFDENQNPYVPNNGFKSENPNIDLDSVETNTLISSLSWSPEEAYQNPSPGPLLEDLSPNSNTFISSISWSPESDPFTPGGGSLPSPPLSDESDSDPILKYLTEMLMEENAYEEPSIAQDFLALQAKEKSLNEVLAGNSPSLSDNNTLSPGDSFLSTSNTSGGYLEASSLQDPPSSHFSVNEFLAQNIFSDRDSILQFQRGLEEASKFLPSDNQLIVKNEMESSKNESLGRKNHEREEDIDLVEGKINKQPAVYFDESELSEMFDKVLLFGGKPDQPPCTECEAACQNEASNNSQLAAQPQGSRGGTSRVKRQSNKAETVDLRTLLTLSAQAVSSDDRRTATELLKQIRQHSSPSGDGSQRLAHYFANGLEARLAGARTHKFPSLALERRSVADILKVFHLYLSCCPFKKLAIAFAIKTIIDMSENATTIHLVDFGIGYGFQWPALIWNLAYRKGGPPKLRITGIDYPQPGFRPDEGIKQAGRRLANYCERFKVPFEYNAISSQNWETIKLEDLKIGENETLFASCLFRFQNLFDETVEKSSPRDVVLNLIREMKPTAFIHSIVSGSYNSPFFVTRFREALFHYSALFDMFDTTVPREDQERAMFEREFLGEEAMNVIACEGSGRTQRPETYKQWQARSVNAGLRQLPLDQELMTKLRGKLSYYGYHKDFVVDEASRWMLQGWKGRILFASSCWAPK